MMGDQSQSSRSGALNANDSKQLDQLENQITELRKSVLALLWRLESQPETLNWPSVVSRYNHITAQLATLKKIMISAEMPDLRNIALLPLHVQQEVDENLQQITEGRLSVCSHEVIPNYLRTKLEPDVDSHLRQLYQRAQSSNNDQMQKQLNAYNKVMKSLCDHFERAVEEHNRSSKQRDQQNIQKPMYSDADTHAIAAYKHAGKGLSTIAGYGRYQNLPPRHMPPP